MTSMSELPHRRNISISPGRLAVCLVVVAVAAFITGAEIHPQAVTISPITICSTETEAKFPEETPYLAENDATMGRMMSGMVIKPTGDVDRDFVAMMSPHHQGAIEMAQAVLRNGHNEQIRRLAQEIIVTQQQEIAAMRLAIGDPLPPSTPSPTQVAGPAVRP
jgi:Domain of unknown function (DUF305)